MCDKFKKEKKMLQRYSHPRECHVYISHSVALTTSRGRIFFERNYWHILRRRTVFKICKIKVTRLKSIHLEPKLKSWDQIVSCGKLKRPRRCDFPQNAHAWQCCIFKSPEQVKNSIPKMVEEIRTQNVIKHRRHLKGARPINSYTYHY